MPSTESSPLTRAWARAIASFSPHDIPDPVRLRALQMILDASGALLAATNPRFSTGQRIARFVAGLGGEPVCTVVGHGFRTNPVNAALANGTMGYACDIEPHHPEGVLHPLAVMLPTALAAGELTGASGERLVGAVVLGCELEYRLSMALGPVEQYDLGFHPSAVTGCFGAAAAAGFLVGLDEEKAMRALGLAACQASGTMAWESDATENSRPFQMGVAARNGITAAMLAGQDFGGPIGVFDHGHTVFRAFSRKADPHFLVRDLGSRFDGIMELAIKPYSSVSFLHPALDLLLGIASRERLGIADVAAITLRFPSSGTHCIDANPLKSHSAQYILPVALTARGLSVADLFEDRRLADPAVAELGRNVSVIADDELDRGFPDAYDSVIEVTTRDGRRLRGQTSIARGYPEAPLSEAEILAKFRTLAGTVANPARIEALHAAIAGLWQAPDLSAYAAAMGARPDAAGEAG